MFELLVPLTIIHLHIISVCKASGSSLSAPPNPVPSVDKRSSDLYSFISELSSWGFAWKNLKNNNAWTIILDEEWETAKPGIINETRDQYGDTTVAQTAYQKGLEWAALPEIFELDPLYGVVDADQMNHYHLYIINNSDGSLVHSPNMFKFDEVIHFERVRMRSQVMTSRKPSDIGNHMIETRKGMRYYPTKWIVLDVVLQNVHPSIQHQTLYLSCFGVQLKENKVSALRSQME